MLTEIKNNKHLGEIGERIVIGELSKYGLDIMLPMSDNLPFDFLIYYKGKFYKGKRWTGKGYDGFNNVIYEIIFYF